MGGPGNFLIYVIVGVVSAAVAFLLGYFLKHYLTESKLESTQTRVQQMLSEAEAQAKEMLLAAKDEGMQLRDQFEQEIARKRREVEKQESRVQNRLESLDNKLEQIEKRERRLNQRQSAMDKKQNQIDDMETQRMQELERISGLTPNEAKELLLQSVEKTSRQDMARVIREVEIEIKEQADRKAREVISLAIQRCAADQVSETTVSTVALPNDEMKGRIIGRGGTKHPGIGGCNRRRPGSR